MILIMANWNPNDTLNRSSLLSFKLSNIWPLILASVIIPVIITLINLTQYYFCTSQFSDVFIIICPSQAGMVG